MECGRLIDYHAYRTWHESVKYCNQNPRNIEIVPQESKTILAGESLNKASIKAGDRRWLELPRKDRERLPLRLGRLGNPWRRERAVWGCWPHPAPQLTACPPLLRLSWSSAKRIPKESLTVTELHRESIKNIGTQSGDSHDAQHHKR